MIKESQHTEKKNPYTHQRKRKPKLGNQQAERKREAYDQSKHIYVHWIKYKKTWVQRRRREIPSPQLSLGPLKGVWERKNSSTVVEGWMVETSNLFPLTAKTRLLFTVDSDCSISPLQVCNSTHSQDYVQVLFYPVFGDGGN